jgi:hypothetical protein
VIQKSVPPHATVTVKTELPRALHLKAKAIAKRRKLTLSQYIVTAIQREISAVKKP